MTELPTPTAEVGETVLYRLTSQDVLHLADHADHRDRHVRLVSGTSVAALVVAVSEPNAARPYPTANLRLFLDGDMDGFVKAVEHGPFPGHWRHRGEPPAVRPTELRSNLF